MKLCFWVAFLALTPLSFSPLEAQALSRSKRCPFVVTDQEALNQSFRKAAAAGDYLSLQNLTICGADPNSIDAETGNSALHSAALAGHHQSIKLLLQLGADPNQTNYENSSALMHASQGCHTRALQALLSHQADPNLQDRSGKTALIYASAQACLNGVAYLLRVPGIQTSHQDDSHQSALHYADKQKNPVIAALLRQHLQKTENSSTFR